MWNWLRRKKKPKFKYTEGVDFYVMPDVEAARRGDPHPWNISFLGRLVKVHSLKLPDLKSDDNVVAVKAEMLYGNEFNDQEQQAFGDLLMELVQRNIMARDK